MVESIYFSGLISPFYSNQEDQSLDRQGLNSVDLLLKEFFHYMGKIWTASVDDPTKFKVAQVIDSYRKYKSSGGRVSVNEGLSLEESYFVTSIVSPASILCFLNSKQSDTSTIRMSQVRRLPPQQIISFLYQSYEVKINTTQSISEQLQTWNNNQNCPQYITLVYDGETGHCIMVTGVEKGLDRFVFWDPWPLRSLLCIENNIAGVKAQAVSKDENFWTISAEDLAKVIYSVFVPERLLG